MRKYNNALEDAFYVYGKNFFDINSKAVSQDIKNDQFGEDSCKRKEKYCDGQRY
jgi:hypothetical protein